ncbi:MAG: MBL fold metallo-hydrolase [Burkholderiaceae bacterium]
MKLRVLGCSGGIGAQIRTTSFLVDHDVLIDAGTGVEDLSVAELADIDHVFLTHSHLDHIAALPLLVDSVGAMRREPLLVHALPETILALRQHLQLDDLARLHRDPAFRAALDAVRAAERRRAGGAR